MIIVMYFSNLSKWLACNAKRYILYTINDSLDIANTEIDSYLLIVLLNDL